MGYSYKALRNNPLFENVSDTVLTDLLRGGHLLELKKKNLLFLQGSTDDNIYYLMKGSVRSYYYRGKEEYTDTFYHPGDFVANFDSIFFERPSSQTIECLSSAVFISFSKKMIISKMRTHPVLIKLFCSVLVNHVTHTKDRLGFLINFSSVKKSYAEFHRCNASWEIFYPNKDVASYLGTTPESLVRIKHHAKKLD